MRSRRVTSRGVMLAGSEPDSEARGGEGEREPQTETEPEPEGDAFSDISTLGL